MHIIIGALSAILTLLYILERLGIDVGWYNPWSWRRRRAWAKRYEGDPIYSVEEPMDVAAILIAGVLKLEGDITKEQREDLLELFEEKFSQSRKEAADLLGSATHLLGAPQIVETQLDGVAGKTKDLFNAEQSASLLEMMQSIAGENPTPVQANYIAKMRALFHKEKRTGTWAQST